MLKEELLMTKVQETSAVNQVDLMWDGWLNNLKSMQSFQEDVQQTALQAFSYQKEMLDLSVKTINTLEEESKKVTKDWNEKVQSNVTQSNFTQTEQVSQWLSNIQEITERVQLLSWHPSHALLDLFNESQKQVEVTMKKALDSQQKNQSENYRKIKELTEQMKAAHKRIVNPTKA